MKDGRSLQELAAEVARQQEAKRDFVVNTRALAMGNDAEHLIIRGYPEDLVIGDIAHTHIVDHTKIPAPYYKRLREQMPDLLSQNVNAWFNREPADRLVRTLDHRARAMLSSAYRRLDNVDFMEATIPPLMELGVEVMSCEITERRLYLKVVDKRITRDLPTGVELGKGHHRFDTVSPALVLSNSEVGSGALSLETSVWTGGCSNLVVIQERSQRRYHVGTRADLGEEVFRLLTDETKLATDRAVWMQLRDLVGAAFAQAQFDAVCDKIAATAKDDFKGDPVKVVEVTAKKLDLTDTERGSVLAHLIKGGDLTRYGLHAAITRTAEDLPSYDRASELERLGGRLIELPTTEWAELATAA